MKNLKKLTNDNGVNEDFDEKMIDSLNNVDFVKIKSKLK
jgi:hypothetical protein